MLADQVKTTLKDYVACGHGNWRFPDDLPQRVAVPTPASVHRTEEVFDLCCRHCHYRISEGALFPVLGPFPRLLEAVDFVLYSKTLAINKDGESWQQGKMRQAGSAVASVI